MSRDSEKQNREAPVEVTRDGRLIKSPIDIIRSPGTQRDLEQISRLIKEGKLPLQKKK